MRISRDSWAMGLAIITSMRATCPRRSVGCVLLDADGYVLSTGFNGVASGRPHCNELKDLYKVNGPKSIIGRGACAGAWSESGSDLDKCEAIHAEQNALLQCKDVRAIDTCYVTTSPCVTCAKLLLNTKCKRIVYLEEYASTHTSAKLLWENSGRLWQKHSPVVEVTISGLDP